MLCQPCSIMGSPITWSIRAVYQPTFGLSPLVRHVYVHEMNNTMGCLASTEYWKEHSFEGTTEGSHNNHSNDTNNNKLGDCIFIYSGCGLILLHSSSGPLWKNPVCLRVSSAICSRITIRFTALLQG